MSLTCLMSDPVCPSTIAACSWASFCSDGLSSCYGVCATPTPTLPASACLVSNPTTNCKTSTEECYPFSAACTTSNCFGSCIPTFHPTPSGGTVSCYINAGLAGACSFPYTCSPTVTSPSPAGAWGGACVTPAPLPQEPVVDVNCLISNPSTGCVTTATCSPAHRSCTTTGCPGSCSPTGGPTPPPTGCVMSGTPTCVSPSTCTPTMSPTPGVPQGGVCITPAPPGPSSACLVFNTATACSESRETCAPFYEDCTTRDCLGTCIGGPTPIPKPHPHECGHHRWAKCGRGWHCERREGHNCGPGAKCPGVCRKERHHGWGHDQ